MEVKKIDIIKGSGKNGIGKLIFHSDGEEYILEVDELLRFIDENHHRIGELERKLIKLMERKSLRERFRQAVAKVWKSIREREG